MYLYNSADTYRPGVTCQNLYFSKTKNSWVTVKKWLNCLTNRGAVTSYFPISLHATVHSRPPRPRTKTMLRQPPLMLVGTSMRTRKNTRRRRRNLWREPHNAEITWKSSFRFCNISSYQPLGRKWSESDQRAIDFHFPIVEHINQRQSTLVPTVAAPPRKAPSASVGPRPTTNGKFNTGAPAQKPWTHKRSR